MESEIESQRTVQMPLYRCHKEVWALKIKEIHVAPEPKFRGAVCRGCFALGNACGHCERCRWEQSDHNSPGSAVIVPEEAGYGAVHVTREYMQKHAPQAGGYYVLYRDGYASYSPASAFEEGYSKV